MAGKMGSFSAADLKRLQKQLDKVQEDQLEAFVEECAKELAARLLARVIKRTPVGDYSEETEVVAKRASKHHQKGDVYKKRSNPSGKMGGTLRRGWTAKTHKEAEGGSGSGTPAAQYASSLKITRNGDQLAIRIENPVEYASYVEYGHRQTPGRYVPGLGRQLKQSWVPGQFILTASEQEIQEIAPQVLEARIKRFLGACMK